MARESLDDLINERQRKREKLERQLGEVDAELRALYEAKKLMTVDADQLGQASDESGAEKNIKRRERKLKPEWVNILYFIGHEGPVSLDEIDAYIDKNDMNINRNTLRSQLSLYNTRYNFLYRTDNKRYMLTDYGRQRISEYFTQNLSEARVRDNK